MNLMDLTSAWAINSKKMKTINLFAMLMLLFGFFSTDLKSETRLVYLSPEQFITNTFGSTPPEEKKLWLKKNLKPKIQSILNHKYPALRIPYWKRGNKTAWILEEIGKERLITTGIVVESGVIQEVNVLIYRETRGGEVRHNSFTRQFKGAILNTDNRLDRNIDSISGATLSSRALEKLARLALTLDSVTQVNP